MKENILAKLAHTERELSVSVGCGFLNVHVWRPGDIRAVRDLMGRRRCSDQGAAAAGGGGAELPPAPG
jgi:hypothetical protein